MQHPVANDKPTRTYPVNLWLTTAWSALLTANSHEIGAARHKKIRLAISEVHVRKASIASSG
jgi:hypothetical protein